MLLRFLFLMWTTLNSKVLLILRVGRKWKGRAGDNCKSALNIEFESDWSFTLGGTLGERKKIKKYYSSYKDFFREKPIVAIFLGFECTINPQNLIIIVGAIFEKMKILNFFLMWTTLNFEYRSKTKKKSWRCLQGDPRYRMWTRLVCWFRCYVRRRTEN